MNGETEIPTGKGSELYASQISASADEKVADIFRLIANNALPRYDGKIHVLELGTGGGDSFQRLQELLSDRDDTVLMGVDSIGPFLRQFMHKVGATAVLAEVGTLPFGGHTLSAINASAIFHEVSTYGVSDSQGRMVRGNVALTQTMREITRALLPNGVLAYRDVYCPINREEMKRVIYREKSWQLFINKYLPGLIEVYERVVAPVSGRISRESIGEGVCIEAPVQIHREIQRHYITFRDYFRRSVAPDNGVEVLREDWIDQSTGMKRHTIILPSAARPLRITLDSDAYDALTDALICELFESRALDDWFKREGAELYTLVSAHELMLLAEQGRCETNRGIFKLTPRYDASRMSSRDYYQRYLRRVIDRPELEAKQHLQFVNLQQ